jgi:hypothetical protein
MTTITQEAAMQDDLVDRLLGHSKNMERDKGKFVRFIDVATCTEAVDLITALTAERDALAGIVRGWHWLAVGPDEMGDYQHQRELIKASEPYASPALRAIAAGAHKK